MEAEQPPGPGRRHFTIVAEPLEQGAWHITVRELPRTWTVAFEDQEIEWRARQRIAFDLSIEALEFDVTVLRDGGRGSR